MLLKGRKGRPSRLSSESEYHYGTLDRGRATMESPLILLSSYLQALPKSVKARLIYRRIAARVSLLREPYI